MTSPNGLPKGGVVLGGRELRIRIDTKRANNLKVLAQMHGVGVHQYAELLLSRAVDIACQEIIAAQLSKALMNVPIG